MSDWPNGATRMPGSRNGLTVINPLSWLSFGSATHMLTNGAPTSTAWPAANRMLLVPFRVPYLATARKMSVGCGATAGGNFIVALYDRLGNRLYTSSSTARSANSEVVVDITDTTLLRGMYWMGLILDGTNTILGFAPSNAGQAKAIGLRQASPGSFTAPDPITFETPAAAFVPAGLAVHLEAF